MTMDAYSAITAAFLGVCSVAFAVIAVSALRDRDWVLTALAAVGMAVAIWMAVAIGSTVECPRSFLPDGGACPFVPESKGA